MTNDSGHNSKDPKTASRLAKHLQLMGLDDSGIADADLASERSGIDNMQPPPLNLGGLDHLDRLRTPGVRSPRRASGPRYGIGLLAVAAGLAFMVFVNRGSDDQDLGYRVKGAARVTVHTDVGGVVTTWDKTSALADGTKIRVEVKALEDTVAFIGVRSGRGEDLFPVAKVWSQRLEVTAGAVGLSSGSIELTGAVDDEVLVAVSCPKGAAPKDLGALAEAWQDLDALGKRCVVERLRLR